MSIAVFKVLAKFDRAGGRKNGTVSIDRETNVVHVREGHSRRVYSMHLSQVANYICVQGSVGGALDKMKP